MSIILLTIFFSLLLVLFFLAFFLWERWRCDQSGTGPEQQSLLPLEEDADGRPRRSGNLAQPRERP